MKTKSKKKQTHWRDALSERYKKRLIKCLLNGGGIIHRSTRVIFCDLRACPYELEINPEAFRECTEEDLINDKDEVHHDKKNAIR